MSSIAVSCVIPTHGRPEYLREAIESVLAQSIKPAEIIVVSDDANADSKAVAQSFEEAGAAVHFFRNTDAPGASGSRNLGASRATGKWLAFLDDDDLWHPDFILHAAEVIDRTDTDLTISWVEMFREDLRAPGINIGPNVTARDAASRTPGLTGSNFVIRRTAFEDLGGFDPGLPVMNDIDFLYRYLLSGGTYEVNANPDLLQRRHNSGQLTKATEFRADGIRKYVAKHQQTLSGSDRRHLRLAEHRIRYRAATSPVKKVRYLLTGLANASLHDLTTSVKNWGQRDLWHARG